MDAYNDIVAYQCTLYGALPCKANKQGHSNVHRWVGQCSTTLYSILVMTYVIVVMSLLYASWCMTLVCSPSGSISTVGHCTAFPVYRPMNTEQIVCLAAYCNFLERLHNYFHCLFYYVCNVTLSLIQRFTYNASPRDRSLSRSRVERDFATDCVSVRLSVCLTHAAIDSKPMTVGSWGFNHRVAQDSDQLSHSRSQGNPHCEDFKRDWRAKTAGKTQIFNL